MRRSLLPTRTIEVKLPIDLLQAVDGRLYDIALDRTGYGQRTALITRLLREWVNSTPLHPKIEALQNLESQATLEDLLSKE